MQLRFSKSFLPVMSYLVFASALIAVPLLPAHAQLAANGAPIGLAAPSVTLLPEDSASAFHPGGKEVVKGKISLVKADHPDFKTAIRAETTEPVSTPFALQLAAKNTAVINKGDVLFASFWARTTAPQSGEGFVGFTFEQGIAPFKRSLGIENSLGKEWRQFNFPFKAAESYAPGEANFNLRLGYGVQTIEIGGITLRNYGGTANIADLPFTGPTYIGREPDAPWRKAALERIEKIRKASFHITVRDKNGQPVPNAKVSIVQIRQAFGIGSAVNAKALLSEDPADQIYSQKVKELFNKVVFENDLKWGPWKNDRDSPQRAIKLLRDANIDVRGHVLVWPSWRHSPPELEATKNDPAVLQKLIADHIADEAGTLRGQLPEWDVLNEPYDNHDVMDLVGPQVQLDWYKLAHQADPTAKLYFNDYNILEAGGADSQHQKHYEETISYLVDHGAPLDGIGIQGHFGWNLTSPEKMLQILDRFSKFKKPIQITEFDIQVTDEKLQADFTRDFLITMFSHPSVNGVLMWGFWEGRHWAPSAALWRKDWSVKPNGQAWLDLVKKDWLTNVEARTDEKGVVDQRGFLGDYTISVSVDGQSLNQKATLQTAGETRDVVLTLP